ncbi:hypothetical protein [Thermostaphylospora chromogena]|uniref:Uncharacterized protein n=1 Tax=Thermostaphylospora chromogena TaxID=35622 RepID=A0A1H0XK17_9ACTN|nr:hypothetical protein [Thermostaphylospora chromogena]SDQ03151.1 hypothetical protein SAMN04489764_0010 [Thermostaphylospora chromogena]SDQ03260.1 hypothetical protein SAMN04489764_0033 [Thermostaphylospora chromogena]SDQ03422.1 hypothetical protein SAMN04489764_0059 [Thermostaphylospora chromogena]
MRQPEAGWVLRALWLAVILIGSIIAAIVCGVLTWLGGVHPALAVVNGAGGFATTVGVFLAIAHFLSEKSPS